MLNAVPDALTDSAEAPGTYCRASSILRAPMAPRKSPVNTFTVAGVSISGALVLVAVAERDSLTPVTRTSSRLSGACPSTPGRGRLAGAFPVWPGSGVMAPASAI